MRPITTRQAITLGCIFIVVAILLGLGIFGIGFRGNLGSKPLGLKAFFPEIRGVAPGTRVRILGMDAGEVSRIIAPQSPGNPVEVEFLVQGRYRGLIRQDSTVAIHSEGLLGVKVLELNPGSETTPPISSEGVVASKPSTDFADVLKQASDTFASIKQGDGSLGKLAKDSKLYDSLVQLTQQTNQTMQSFQQDADALKKMPIVRSYVENPIEIIVRPNADCRRKTLDSEDLFDPGTAILNPLGRKHLDEIVPWINGFPKDSEMVIVGFHQNISNNMETSKLLCRQQAEAVMDYLKNQHSVHKNGWFSRRKITPLGLGTRDVPTLGVPTENKYDRVELLLFPQRG